MNVAGSSIPPLRLNFNLVTKQIVGKSYIQGLPLFIFRTLTDKPLEIGQVFHLVFGPLLAEPMA